VLVAEELFVCGCRALVSIGSAGLISQDLQPPFFLLIERAYRDEGTSYHYLPPSPFVEADQDALNRIQAALGKAEITARIAATWTTDAPFRETTTRIEFCRNQGIVAVEMEAAGLLAFAASRKQKVVCLSHITNRMARNENDFDKGGLTGLDSAIRLCEETLQALLDDGKQSKEA
jgi:uridine phosphorylase